MKPVAKFILWSRMCKLYKNGNSFGFVWNWFNPLSWVCFPILFLTQVIMYGILETWRYKHEIGLGMNPYFKEHPEKLVWIKRNPVK